MQDNYTKQQEVNVARTQSQTYVHNIPEHRYLMIVVGVGRCARVPSTNLDPIILTQMGIYVIA